METNKIVIDNSKEKKSCKVKTFFYNLFVKNAGYKAISLVVAGILWMLLAGL